MKLNSIILLFLNLFLLLFLTACTKNVQPQNEMYSLEECKQELLEAEDYSQEKSVDYIVVNKKSVGCTCINIIKYRVLYLFL
ncbi:MAG: Unknown protein [uncultured Sulfurovum sp.]|uniref:Lipoprotein n=1 Tax=uncultured Sulfurovum sp. TaxID=269237 RepID=A0A6S6T154_9BACT|nr:MAG: Unknown protein [uncultured Sulfurovum sp.]